jgi:hypothetical protein
MEDDRPFIEVSRSSKNKPPPKTTIVPLCTPSVPIPLPATSAQRIIENARVELPVHPSNCRRSPSTGIHEYNPNPSIFDLVSHLLSATKATIHSSITPNNSFSNISEFPHSNTDFPKFFHTVLKIRKNGHGTAFIFFTVESDHTDGIENIRQTPSVLSHLQSKKIYLYPHEFPSFETIIIGSLFHKSHDFTNRTILQNTLLRHLNKFLASPAFQASCNDNNTLANPKTHPPAFSNPDGSLLRTLASADESDMSDTEDDPQTPTATLTPYFELVIRSITHTISPPPDFTDITLDTKSLQIKCCDFDADAMTKIISLANLPQSQFGTFIPARLALTDRPKFGQLIIDHNNFLNRASKIIVHGLHPSVLQAYIAHPGQDDPIKSIVQHVMDEHYMEQPATTTQPAIPKMHIFTSIEQTSKSFSEGTWYFITDDAFRSDAISFLQQLLLRRATQTNEYKQTVRSSSFYTSGIMINPSGPRLAPNSIIDQYISNLTAVNPMTYNCADNTSLKRNKPKRRPRNTLLTYDCDFPSIQDNPPPSSSSKPAARITSSSTSNPPATSLAKACASPPSESMVIHSKRIAPINQRTDETPAPPNQSSIARFHANPQHSQSSSERSITSQLSPQNDIASALQQFMAQSLANQAAQAAQNAAILQQLSALNPHIQPSPPYSNIARKRQTTEPSSPTTPAVGDTHSDIEYFDDDSMLMNPDDDPSGEGG